MISWHNYSSKRGRGTIDLRMSLWRLGLEVEIDLDELLPELIRMRDGDWKYIGFEWGGLSGGLELRARR